MWKGWCLFRCGCKKSSLWQPWGLSCFLRPYRFALEMPCVALRVGATMKESESAWPSPIFQLTKSTRPQQWQQQEAPASHTRSGKHTNMWFPFLGLTIVMTHRNIRCLQRSLFVTKTDWWLVGSYRVSNVFICLILLPLMGQAFANEIMNQKL